MPARAPGVKEVQRHGQQVRGVGSSREGARVPGIWQTAGEESDGRRNTAGEMRMERPSKMQMEGHVGELCRIFRGSGLQVAY
jgi:hypothetical protein